MSTQTIQNCVRHAGFIKVPESKEDVPLEVLSQKLPSRKKCTEKFSNLRCCFQDYLLVFIESHDLLIPVKHTKSKLEEIILNYLIEFPTGEFQKFANEYLKANIPKKRKLNTKQRQEIQKVLEDRAKVLCENRANLKVTVDL